MDIKKNYDVRDGAPDWSKGTNPFDNKGIQPVSGAIKDTPGENETNPAAAHSTNKGQPFGPGGAGYTGGKK